METCIAQIIYSRPADKKKKLGSELHIPNVCLY
jgi:hypothetical protein